MLTEMTLDSIKLVICGSGNGAHAFAGIASSLKGTDVRVLTLSRERAALWNAASQERKGANSYCFIQTHISDEQAKQSHGEYRFIGPCAAGCGPSWLSGGFKTLYHTRDHCSWITRMPRFWVWSTARAKWPSGTLNDHELWVFTMGV